MDDPSLTAALAKSVEGIVPDEMMEEMNVMMEAMVTFMETGELDDLKPMLEKVQNVETHVDETMKNMGMEASFDEMSNEIQNEVGNQVAQAQDSFAEVYLSIDNFFRKTFKEPTKVILLSSMGITTQKSDAAINREDDENRVVVTASNPT